MKALKSAGIAAALFLAGCGGPVPSGVFLSMTVSTGDTTVETSLNGKANDFLSGDSGSMSASVPLNKYVHAGENEIVFLVGPAGDIAEIDPKFFASLEVSLKGEMVDTLAPGPRTLFTRELTEAETAAVARGETVTIIQTFTVDRQALEAMKAGN